MPIWIGIAGFDKAGLSEMISMLHQKLGIFNITNMFSRIGLGINAETVEKL